MLEASIIIPTYNKACYLSKTLTALNRQVDERFEIIVVDDGSTDNTKEVSEGFKVTYIMQKHKGVRFALARNNGARAAASDYLIFLDDDIMVCPVYLKKVLEGKNRYHDRVVQSGYIWDYTGKGDPDIRTQYGVWDRPGILTKRFYHINGGNFAVHKSLYWEAGGNNEDLIHYGVEDTLFGYLISQMPGTFVVYNREMEGFHLPHPASWRKHRSLNWKTVKKKYPKFYFDFEICGMV